MKGLALGVLVLFFDLVAESGRADANLAFKESAKIGWIAKVEQLADRFGRMSTMC